MCGRFTLTLEVPELQRELGIGEFPDDFHIRYNIAPTQPVAVVRDPDSRQVEWMRWGLVPPWADSVEIGNRMINARSETIAEKPSFRGPFRKQRCLILADGFYEWEKRAKGKSVPYVFRRKDNKPFAFAGLWAVWTPAGAPPITSCTIITCPANDLVHRVHERMPVIFDQRMMWHWLQQPSQPILQQMLVPYEAPLMLGFAVTSRVNSPNYDSPDCMQPDPLADTGTNPLS